MTRLLIVIALLGSPEAGAKTSRTWLARACARVLAREAPPPAREALLGVHLRALAQVPQRVDYLNLVSIANYLVDPIPSATLLAPVGRAEFALVARAMNRAHAAHGVRAVAQAPFWTRVRSALGHRRSPSVAARVIPNDELVSLVDYSLAALVLQLAELQARIEGRYHRRVAPGENQVDEFLSWSRARKRAYGERLDRFYRVSRAGSERVPIADWGRRLRRVLQSAEVRETARAYRAEVVRLSVIPEGPEREGHELRNMRELSAVLTRTLGEEFRANPDDRVFFEFLLSVFFSEKDVLRQFENA